jgi:SOS-response transcriptional repressor LexA
MGWADAYVTALVAGKTVSFRPTGNSMVGKISSGQLCTVAPVTPETALATGDVVLCRVHGSTYLHLIKAIQGDRFQIANNRGHTNGWTGRAQIFGRLISVES